MHPADIAFQKASEAVRNGEQGDLRELGSEIQSSLAAGLQGLKTEHFLSRTLSALEGKKDRRLLDFGCGGGKLVMFLRALGYRHCYGVDVADRSVQNRICASLGFGDDEPFTTYDQQTLPYPDGAFELICSELVLEHVKDAEAYYREAARVLVPGGKALLEFPHRHTPYDSHSRTWFIHWLPLSLRRPLYDRFTENGSAYFELILHLRSVSEHRRLARRHFAEFRVTTTQRLKRSVNLEHYEGNRRLRAIAQRLMKTPVLGRAALHVMARLASADVDIYKDDEPTASNNPRPN
jgi:SAM-dependent methyltransferase